MKGHLRILLICIVTSFLVTSFFSDVTANTDCDLVDVVVILPGSNAVTDSEFNDLKRTVLLLIRGMAISESKTRLATVSYGSVVSSSSTYLLGDRMILGSSVMSMTKIGGSNDVGRGLEMGRLLLNNNKRYEVARVSVVIYKNVSMPAMIEAQQHADKMVDDGIRVISIGIGSSVLSHLAFSQELAYNFTSTKKLLSSFREIPKYICKAIQTPNQQSEVALSSTTMSSIDEKQTTKDYKEIPEICKRAKWVNGVGYAAVEGDLRAFAMCFKGLHNVMKVSYKECPQGQHWSKEEVTCVRITRVETPQEVTSLCQLMPVYGSPNKFKQRTGFGSLKEFECPTGTVFNNETCGCSTFNISEYMAKQQQESNTCTPELYLPFCGDLNDFSGKNTYIQEIGHVRLREGKAYFDGKSYLFIPRFTGIKYGDTVVIKLKYLAEDEEKYVNIEDKSPSLTQFSLISNGICHGKRCETPSSISIGGKKGATIFNVVSAGDTSASYYIVSEHIRHKRQVSEDGGVKEGMQEELVEIHQEPMAASTTYQENNLSSDEPIGIEDSEEIRDDEPQINDIEIPDRIPVSNSGAEAFQFQPSLKSFVTDTTDNDYDIILEPNDIINIQIPTTAVPKPFTEKSIKSESKIQLENTETGTKKDELEETDESKETDNEDNTTENFDIIFNSSDTNDIRELIHEIKESILKEESDSNTSKYVAVDDSDMQDIQENVNYDILFGNSEEGIGELLSNILKGNKKHKDQDYIKIGKSFSSEMNVGNRDNSTDSEEIDTSVNDLNNNPEDLSSDEITFENDATIETDLGLDLPSKVSTNRLEVRDFDLILNDTSYFNLKMIDASEEEEDDVNENKITSLEVNKYNTSTENNNNGTSLKVDEYDNSEEERYNVTSLGVDEYDTSTEKRDNVTSLEVDEDDSSTEKNNDATLLEVDEYEDSEEENDNITSLVVDEYDTSTETTDNVTSLEVDEYHTSTETTDNVTSLEVDEYDTSTEIRDSVILLENGNNTETATPKDDSSINSETETKKKSIWRSVILKIKDGVIQASVDGRKEDERYFSGQIRTTQTGFYIGAGTGGQNFKGYIDEVYIYFCDPDEETLDEKYRKLLKERRFRELTDRKQNSRYSACDFVNPRAHEWLQTRK